MFCPKCGTRNDDAALRCTACQADIQPAKARLGDDRTMRMLMPVGRSGWAIAAGYAGLFALLVFPAPLALILGVIAVIHIKRHPGKHGMGRAVFAIITGGIGSAALVYLMFA